MSDRYEIKYWSPTLPFYQCLKCPYDTFHADEFEEHWKKRHEVPAPPMPLLFDPEGKQIVREEPNVTDSDHSDSSAGPVPVNGD